MAEARKSQDLARSAVRALERLGLEFLEGESSLPRRDLPPDKLSRSLGIELGQNGLPFDEVAKLLGGIMAATPSSSRPRFLNQLFGGREPIATLAEMLIALADTSMYTYKVAGAQVLVEREVLSRLLSAIPFADGEGTFSPGGSLANMTAMLVARNLALTSVRDGGFEGQTLRAYTSADSHYSIRKAAGILGLGRNNVRQIDTDSDGRMNVSLLRQAIAEDLENGYIPFFVNATAGTTVLGAIDPLPEIADIAREHRMWLHVDAALAGSVLLSTRYRSLLAGAANSDSMAWNAHKMMGVPLACSVLLLRQRGLLGRHLGEAASYLFQADEEELNPGTRSLQCGRRSDALKLWALWKHLGDTGMDSRMTGLLELAQRAADVVEADSALQLVARPQTVNVCFRIPGVDSDQLCDYLDRHGIYKIGHGIANGQSAVRLVCVNPDLDEQQIVEILEQIKIVGQKLTTIPR